ncbi:MAG: enoyl-CoA hydratase/isomerase family protein [Gammaproteobacteria bacterium]|nr:enoyl-CoA hydratase/isomerase family protein [Gammaproteobacteria bacterium]
MSYQNIVLEPIRNGVYLLTINRPKVLNALNAETLSELGMAVANVGKDSSARVLLITGAGEKAFVAGADIKAMQQLNPIQARALSRQALGAFRALEVLPVPTIAVVNGFALGGGCELAMSCDWILAGENAVFGQPEVGLGIIPGFGGTQRLSRLVGRAMAMELIVTGRHVAAEQARKIGLVNHVYPAASLMEEALSMAHLIASKGPVAVRLAKEVVQRGQDLDLDNACALESQAFGLCFGTTDQGEGMVAFLEKRQPEFMNQ